MSEFWIGLLIIPVLALLALLLWMALSLASWMWKRLHWAMLRRVDVDRNLYTLRFGASTDAPEKSEYLDAANRFRDALLDTPRFHTLAGLGWMVLIVREQRRDPKNGPRP